VIGPVVRHEVRGGLRGQEPERDVVVAAPLSPFVISAVALRHLRERRCVHGQSAASAKPSRSRRRSSSMWSAMTAHPWPA